VEQWLAERKAASLGERTMNATAPQSSLAEVLEFRRPAIVRRYAKDHGASLQEAETLFRETLKWLYLCYRSSIDCPESGCSMTPDLEKIDWMWHTFLLFTKDYAEFCERYFGFFLHHVPTQDEEEPREVDEAEVRDRLERQYALVYDVLGEQTLREWHDDCRFAVHSEAGAHA